MVAHACTPSTGETEAGQGQQVPVKLHSETLFKKESKTLEMESQLILKSFVITFLQFNKKATCLTQRVSITLFVGKLCQ